MRRLVCLLCLALSLCPGATTPALADPPADLQDGGDCGIDPSQNRLFRRTDGTTWEFRSFFEPGARVALHRIQPEDVRALAAEVTRLKANRCYEICLRSLVTGPGLNQAAANCDLMFVIAHGSKDPPFIAAGGRNNLQLTSGPTSIRASSIWIGACYGQTSVQALNGPSGTRYRTLPADKFAADGTSGRQDMVKGLTKELSALKTTECETSQRVCILSGVQEINPP